MRPLIHLKKIGLALSLVALLPANSLMAGAYDQSQLSTPFTSWGVAPDNKAAINVVGAWKKFTKKKDVVVAIIDTGIDPNHSQLKDNVYLPGEKVDSQRFGYDFSKGRQSAFTPHDTHGHGTNVTGIVKSVFPEVKIVALKYYNPQASGQENLASTIEALKKAVDLGVDIINYSGGGPEPAEEERKILVEAERKGILIVAAAGNEQSNIDLKKNAYYPASYGLTNIVTVTAYDESLNILPSSNYGKQTVDVAAPGYRIRSTLPYDRAGSLTGTSQATAFVTGVAALLKAQSPNLKPHEIRKLLKESSQKELTLTGKCAAEGRIDAEKALALTSEDGKKAQVRNLATSPQGEGKIIYRLSTP